MGIVYKKFYLINHGVDINNNNNNNNNKITTYLDEGDGRPG